MRPLLLIALSLLATAAVAQDPTGSGEAPASTAPSDSAVVAGATQEADRAEALLDRYLSEWHVDLFGVDHLTGMVHYPDKPRVELPFPFLPDETPGSVSVGTVTDGYLVGSVQLPMPGRTYGILERQLHRDLAYGSEELIDALVAASEEVEDDFDGAILWFGNIGAVHGGDIPYSVSHNAGRDADLAFYTTDPEGNPVQPPDLLHYRDDGTSREYGGYYRFDVPRNWALVRALAESPHAQMQYLFISNGLRRSLLAYAEANGAPADVIARAGLLMRQPGREIPHDDHLHVRIYCAAGDVGAGCENSGRTHPGTDLHRGERRERVEAAVGYLRDGSPEVRVAAIQRLVHLAATDQLDAIQRRFTDPSPVVRREAALALGALLSPGESGPLIQRWEEEDEFIVRVGLLRALGEVGGSEAGTFVASLLSRPDVGLEGGKPVDLRYIAADTAQAMRRAETVVALINALGDEDPELRARAADALHIITNQRPTELEWRSYTLSEADQLAGQAQWQAWLDAHRDEARDVWVQQGFANAGYALSGNARDDGATLAEAAGDEDRWVRINAQRRLMAMTDNYARSLEWSRHDARTYWTRWVRRNPGRLQAL